MLKKKVPPSADLENGCWATSVIFRAVAGVEARPLSPHVVRLNLLRNHSGHVVRKEERVDHLADDAVRVDGGVGGLAEDAEKAGVAGEAAGALHGILDVPANDDVLTLFGLMLL